MSVNYSLKSKWEEEEALKLKKQKECHHCFWITRCSLCNKILASDHHINVHTGKNFTMANSIAVLIDNNSQFLTLDYLNRIKQARNEFDEVHIITNTTGKDVIYDSIKEITKVEYKKLDAVIKNIKKYRNIDINITLFLYPDTKGHKNLISKCEKLGINYIINK